MLKNDLVAKLFEAGVFLRQLSLQSAGADVQVGCNIVCTDRCNILLLQLRLYLLLQVSFTKLLRCLLLLAVAAAFARPSTVSSAFGNWLGVGLGGVNFGGAAHFLTRFVAAKFRELVETSQNRDGAVA